MGESGPTEGEAFAAWCAQLPEVRAEAVRNGATARLERDVVRVREGGSAAAACRKWLSDDDRAWRSWSEPAGVGMAGLPGPSRVPPAGVGDYRCPRNRCGRRVGRDEHGHVPVCAAFDAPMTPVTS